MIKIRKGGINRICTINQYNNQFKRLGYEVVEVETIEVIDLEQYFKGGGWYEYQGKSYRKADLLEVLE